MEHVRVERAVGNQLLKRAMFLFQLRKPLQLRDTHASELLFPTIQGLLAHVTFAAQLRDWCAHVCFMERGGDMLLGVLALLHADPLSLNVMSAVSMDQFFSVGAAS